MKIVKRLRIAFMIMLIWCFAVGCASIEPDFSTPEKDTMEMGELGFDPESFLDEIEEEGTDSSDDSNQDDDGGKDTHNNGSLSKFYYNQLDQKEQEIYNSLLEGFKNHEDTITVYSEDPNVIGEIFYNILKDNPEIYWVRSYQAVTYRSEEGRNDIKPNYFFSKEDCKKINKKIESAKEEFLIGASGKQTDYEKVKYTYEYLVDTVQYGGETDSCQNIDTAFVQKETVCAGYAKATKYLLDSLGVECIYVSGEADNGESAGAHAWNIVRVDGDYCFVDTTWGDPTYTDNAETKGTEGVDYSYLCCNEETLFKTHELESDYDFPQCTTDKWDYYTMNGMYFEEYHTQEIVEHMKKDIESGAEVSVFKFKNKSDYQELSRVLTKGVFTELGDELGESGQKLNGLSYQLYDDIFICKIYWKY